MNSDLFSIERRKINSKFLKQERIVFIAVPKNYETVNLPTLYLLDGGEDEKLNFVLKTIADLLQTNAIESIIIVGIENIDRNYDFTNHTTVRKDRKWVPKFGNANRFRQFITEELIFEIESNYNTTGYKTIIGESLGGLFVLDLLYYYPEAFQQYLVIDPSLWWNNDKLLNHFVNDFETIPEVLKLWLSSSKTIAIKSVTDIFDQWIINKIKPSNYIYKIDLNQTHFSIFNAHFKEIIQWSFPKK